jgi:energy-coupling factor transport system ATP-binding protein
MPEAETPPTGSLRPIELATAAVLALPTVILTVIGWFLPHLSVVAAFGVVPLGVVAYRHRLRALLAAAFAAAVLSFLVAGPGTISNIVECAAIGGLVGTVRRRRWHGSVVIAGTLVVSAVLSAISIGLLLLFSGLRKLTLDQIRNVASGVRRLLVVIPPDGFASGVFHSMIRALEGHPWFVAVFAPFLLMVIWLVVPIALINPLSHLVRLLAGPVHALATGLVRDWWIAVIVGVVVSTVGYALLAWFVLAPVIARLRWVPPANHLDEDADRRPAGPVPAVLDHVSYRYPSSRTDALQGVSLTVEADAYLALVGDNGSGKSTLARILAGQSPTGGTVDRPGSGALGQKDGTALIMQHPETQILGVRVADDVVWGLPDPASVEVSALLDRVGLGGMEDRETSTLSGGELQRLAMAAALARQPRLLISDESTAMVDEEGRHQLVDLLDGLHRGGGVAVVHVSHRPEEAARASRRIRLHGGLIVPSAPVSLNRVAPAVPAAITPPAPARALPLELVGVSHVYSAGTPWAQPALRNIDLTIEPRDGLLVVGDNGSGKSTLAWIMAGLLRPSEGQCLLGGAPITSQVGAVGLAFQHARLQLQRQTIGKDVLAAGAEDEEAVAGALAAVGLDPEEFNDRRVDQLSGGQQRRVAIAGMLARRPSVLVLDEPLAGLDEPSRNGLIDVLASLRHDQGMTVVIISHDLGGVEQVCDRTVRLQAGQILRESAVVVST